MGDRKGSKGDQPNGQEDQMPFPYLYTGNFPQSSKNPRAENKGKQNSPGGLRVETQYFYEINYSLHTLNSVPLRTPSNGGELSIHYGSKLR